MNKTLHYLLIFIAFLSLSLPYAKGQTDTEFWFVAPEVASSHGDSPVLLGLSTVGEAATVRLSFPALPAITPLTYFLGANEVITADLTSLLSTLENKPANAILAKGMLITASAPINAYYHVNHSNNLDIFTLKGRQALGLEFYIPAQYHYRNVHGEHSVDIVATQDNTTIEITPSKNIVGHVGGQTFTIILNRGETFSCRAISGNPSSHLTGSHIVSDKPIAVTNSDDSIVNDPGTGWDLVGDQLVPVKLLGAEYIAVRGEAATERVYITATEDETTVSIDGIPGTERTLNAGVSHFYILRNPSSLIKSNKPIYVWHMSGFTKEAGGALLPPVDCTGLNEVSFVRPFSQDFRLILLTKTENQDGFLLNGTTDIPASSFTTVTGSNGEWVATQLTVPPSLLDFTNQIVNTQGVFHMGLIIHTGRGSAYGYFSNYSGLTLGEAKQFCAGETIQLDAGPGKENYLWSTGDTTQIIEISETGTYWVKADFDICELRDTVEAEAIDINIELGADTIICEYDSLVVDVTYPGANYLWQDASTEAIKTLKEEGEYTVIVSKSGCEDTDTLLLDRTYLPSLDLGPDTLLCLDESITLDAFNPESSYTWQDGSERDEYTASEPGLYWVEREFRNCFQRDTVDVGRRFLSKVSGIDTVLCLGDTLYLDETQQGVTYSWDDGLTSPLRKISERGIYILKAENRCESFEKSWLINIQDCDCFLFVPNVFSPNGDGIHDSFVPQVDCTLSDYNIQIFDRWGKKVFESNSIADQWEGQTGSNLAKEGVYYWVINYEGSHIREERIQKGYVTLMR